MNINHFTISGNLTRDVEIRSVGADKSVASFTIAHNSRYKSADGEQREDVTFVDCEVWGRQGEIAAQYLTKGSMTIVEGSMKQDNWTDKEGQTRYTTEIRVRELMLLGGRAGGGGGDEMENGAPRRAAAPPRAKAAGAAAPTATTGDDFSDFPGALEDEDDDLPF